MLHLYEAPKKLPSSSTVVRDTKLIIDFVFSTLEIARVNNACEALGPVLRLQWFSTQSASISRSVSQSVKMMKNKSSFTQQQQQQQQHHHHQQQQQQILFLESSGAIATTTTVTNKNNNHKASFKCIYNRFAQDTSAHGFR